VPEMLARGINVALGSDGTPSNNNYDMFIEMRFASLIHKYRLGADAMPALSVLRMATSNGAKALSLGEDGLGSLEAGKKADLIILDDGGLRAAPLPDFVRDDPVRRIVSAYQSTSVETSIIDGQLVMEDGRLLTMDEEQVLADARQAWETITKKVTLS
jgi:5-methylthioadenosine/S-adenosylhomocysteine deaminase